MKAILTSRWGTPLHEINLYSCKQFREINGEDYIDIETDEPLSYGDRLLIMDGNGVWFEYVFDQGEQAHKGIGKGNTFTCTCDNSFMFDTSYRQIRETVGWNNVNCKYAVTELLKLHPLWSVGEVLSTDNKNLEYKRESLYMALLETAGTFDCEIKREIKVDKNGVVSRTVSFVKQMGKKTNIRFDYGDGITSVNKIINDEPVITACYGYGSSIDGQDMWCYVRNDEAITQWGMPDGSGGLLHSEGEYTNNDIEDMAALQQATADYLNAHSAPSITYEMEEPYLCIQGAELGDTIQSVDADFYPQVRLDTRIGAIERDMITNVVTRATFGTVISHLPDALMRPYDQNVVIIRQTEIISGLRSDLSATQSSLRSAQTDLSNAKGSISSLTSELSDANIKLAQTERDLATAKTDAASAKQTANSLAVTVQSQDKTIKDLQADVKSLTDLWNSEMAMSRKYVNAYNSTWGIGDIWLKARRGTELSSYDISVARDLFSSYQRSVNEGAHRNESVEQMYNEIMLVADQGIEGPTIGDEQTGPELDTNQTDQDEPPKEE